MIDGKPSLTKAGTTDRGIESHWDKGGSYFIEKKQA
jgi:hypothetical protein